MRSRVMWRASLRVESLIEDGEPVPVEDDLIECRVTVETRESYGEV